MHSQFIPSCKQNSQPSRKEKGQVNSRTTRPRAHLNALSREGGARLDLPYAVTDGVQVETLCDLGGGGGCQQVLLVGEDQHRNPTQLLLIQQLSQLLKGTNTRSAKKKPNAIVVFNIFNLTKNSRETLEMFGAVVTDCGRLLSTNLPCFLEPLSVSTVDDINLKQTKVALLCVCSRVCD